MYKDTKFEISLITIKIIVIINRTNYSCFRFFSSLILKAYHIN